MLVLERVEDEASPLETAISGRHVGRHADPITGGEGTNCLLEATHRFIPRSSRALRIVSMSLSPRPERFTSTVFPASASLQASSQPTA